MQHNYKNKPKVLCAFSNSFPRTIVLQVCFVEHVTQSTVFVTHQDRSSDELGESVEDKTTLARVMKTLMFRSRTHMVTIKNTAVR